MGVICYLYNLMCVLVYDTMWSVNVYIQACMCVCACVCVCVCVRERERVKVCLWVDRCVSLCNRERVRERDTECVICTLHLWLIVVRVSRIVNRLWLETFLLAQPRKKKHTVSNP